MEKLKKLTSSSEVKTKRKRISAKDSIKAAKLERSNYERRAKHQNDLLTSKVKDHYKHFDLNPDKYVYKYLNGTIQRTEETKKFIRETKKRHGLRTCYGSKTVQKYNPVLDDAGKVIDLIVTVASVAKSERYTNISETLTLRKWTKRTKRKKSDSDVNDLLIRRIIESDKLVDRDHYFSSKVMKLDSETWSEYKKRKKEIFDLMYKGSKVLSDDHVNEVHQDKPVIKHSTINYRDNNWNTVKRHTFNNVNIVHADQYEYDNEVEYVEMIHLLRKRKTLEILCWLFCE